MADENNTETKLVAVPASEAAPLPKGEAREGPWSVAAVVVAATTVAAVAAWPWS
jgi:hypothetical protein